MIVSFLQALAIDPKNAKALYRMGKVTYCIPYPFLSTLVRRLGKEYQVNREVSLKRRSRLLFHPIRETKALPRYYLMGQIFRSSIISTSMNLWKYVMFYAFGEIVDYY